MSLNTYKYPSTGQYRNAIKRIKEILTFGGLDEEGNVKFKNPSSYLVDYIGTVKLHGTNASIVLHEDGSITCQSKTCILRPGEDNAGFAAAMSAKDLNALFMKAKHLSYCYHGEITYPIEIAGEWVGTGICKGITGINKIPRTFIIFGMASGINSRTGGVQWLPTTLISDLAHREQQIFNIVDFGAYSIKIDFEFPGNAQNELARVTGEVEKECPVAKSFGIEGVGEGVVWKPVDPILAADTDTWFKVKGDKHSISNVKTIANVDVEKIANIQEFTEYAVTLNRLEQGLSEVGLDKTKIGDYIRWVVKDILKEESDVLEGNGLTSKDISQSVSTKARNFYMSSLDKEQF